VSALPFQTKKKKIALWLLLLLLFDVEEEIERTLRISLKRERNDNDTKTFRARERLFKECINKYASRVAIAIFFNFPDLGKLARFLLLRV
jgi:hypothetical protein